MGFCVGNKKIIDSLKSWFEKEWLFERHLTSELMKDKEAFRRGCENFDGKNYSFEGELYALLRKEAGLAEIARVNKDLEKYALHSFRQIEKVFSEFVFVNPGRQKIGKYLLNGQDMILNPVIISNLNQSVSNLLNHTYQNSLSKYCLILKLNHIKKINSYCYQAPDINHSDDAIKSIDHKDWKLTQSEQEKIFKSILYFDTFGNNSLSQLMNNIQNKPSLVAFNHMYHFRNLGSHLNSQPSSLQLPKNLSVQEQNRLSLYYTHPTEVMNINNESPGFYQRYIDTMLGLYSDFLKNPHF
jgi:hypothetical protein